MEIAIGIFSVQNGNVHRHVPHSICPLDPLVELPSGHATHTETFKAVEKVSTGHSEHEIAPTAEVPVVKPAAQTEHCPLASLYSPTAQGSNSRRTPKE